MKLNIDYKSITKIGQTRSYPNQKSTYYKLDQISKYDENTIYT